MLFTWSAMRRHCPERSAHPRQPSMRLRPNSAQRCNNNTGTTNNCTPVYKWARIPQQRSKSSSQIKINLPTLLIREGRGEACPAGDLTVVAHWQQPHQAPGKRRYSVTRNSYIQPLCTISTIALVFLRPFEVTIFRRSSLLAHYLRAETTGENYRAIKMCWGTH